MRHVTDHGMLDPASIEIDGGTSGGAGTVTGDVTLNGATLQAGDASGGNLVIDGAYAQTGGNIVFYIDPNGTGGFELSSLTFTPGESVLAEWRGDQLRFLKWRRRPASLSARRRLRPGQLFQVQQWRSLRDGLRPATLFAGDTRFRFRQRVLT